MPDPVRLAPGARSIRPLHRKAANARGDWKFTSVRRALTSECTVQGLTPHRSLVRTSLVTGENLSPYVIWIQLYDG